MLVVLTCFRRTVAMGTETSRVLIGRATVIVGGVGLGCLGPAAKATPPSRKKPFATASPATTRSRDRANEGNRFFKLVETIKGDEVCIIRFSASRVLLLDGSSIFFVANASLGCTLSIFFKKKAK